MIIISGKHIELLQIPEERLPEGQSKMFLMLMALEKGVNHSLKSVAERLELRSPLPLIARLEHLQKKGLIRVTQPVSPI